MFKTKGAKVTAGSISMAAFIGLASITGVPKTSKFEGTVLKNYYDSVGVKTWCTGETQVGYKSDGNYSEEYCKALFMTSYNKYNAKLYGCYNDTAKDIVTPEIHAAFVDVYYNTGKRCNTGMIRNINKGRPKEACDFILKYKYAGGRDCSVRSNNCYGVWDRRLKMHKLCLEGVDG